jgi:hypothetical protein
VGELHRPGRWYEVYLARGFASTAACEAGEARRTARRRVGEGWESFEFRVRERTPVI